jgi:hypothetical protein
MAARSRTARRDGRAAAAVAVVTSAALLLTGQAYAGPLPDSTRAVPSVAPAADLVVTTVTGLPAAPPRVAFGSAFTATVQVRTGSAYVRRPVTVMGRRWDGAAWTPWTGLVRGTTATDGRYAVNLSRSGAWQLRVDAEATTTAAAGTSAVANVTISGPGCAKPMSSVSHGVAYTRCVARVEGITVQYFVRQGTTLGAVRSPRVAIYFHGDTEPSYWTDTVQWDYADQWKPMPWALAQGYAVVAPIAPKYGPGLEKWGASHKFTKATGRALRKFQRAVGASSAMYWSTSGGSVYLTRSYIPFVGHLLPGPMVLNCGGDIPRFGTRWNPRKRKAARAKLDLFFNQGSRDFLKPYTRKARSYYRAKGFTTKMRTWSGAQHCAHPMGSPTISWFSTH